MKRKISSVLLAVMLVTSLILIACAAPAPAPAPTPAPAPAPAPTPAPAPALPEVSWLLGTVEPSRTDWSVAGLVELGDRVAERTNGKFTIDVPVSDELGVERTALPALLSQGAIEMAFFPGGAVAGDFPHLNVLGLPFLIGSQQGPLVDAHKVEKAIEHITVREFKKRGIAPYTFYPLTPVQLITEERIEDHSDLKGMKVRAWSEAIAAIVTALKGEPVIMSVTETYVAMERGVVDGVLTGVPAMLSMSLYEPGNYCSLINLAPGCIYIAYNIEAFEALPDEYKEILRDEERIVREHYKEAQPKEDEKSLKELEAKGVELIEVSPEESERIVAQVSPLWEEWAAESALNRETLDAALRGLGLK